MSTEHTKNIYFFIGLTLPADHATVAHLSF